MHLGETHTCSDKLDPAKSKPAVTHIITEIISLDACLRFERIFALYLWDMESDMLELQATRNPMHNTKPQRTKCLIVDKRSSDSIDDVPPNAHISSQ